MKKRFAALFLFIFLLLSFSSCNNNNNNSSVSTTTPTQVPVKEPTNKKPTIYLAGDSTVKTYNDNQYIGGWGQFLDDFLSDEIVGTKCRSRRKKL